MRAALKMTAFAIKKISYEVKLFLLIAPSLIIF